MKKGEIVFFGVCVVFFGFMFYDALGLKGHGRSGEIGSSFFPLIALGASILLSVVLLSSSIRKLRGGLDDGEYRTPESLMEKKRQWITVMLSVVCFLAYMVAMPWIGFILSTLIFIPGFSLALGERRKWVLLISPVLLTAVIVAVFVEFIKIPFPKGVWVFAAFSRLFY